MVVRSSPGAFRNPPTESPEEMIRKGFLFAVVLSASLCLPASAQTPSSPNSLKLLPAPKEVRPADGTFELSSRTRIVIDAGHAVEDRNAAEPLTSEIEQQSGEKIPIESTRHMLVSEGAIVL